MCVCCATVAVTVALYDFRTPEAPEFQITNVHNYRLPSVNNHICNILQLLTMKSFFLLFIIHISLITFPRQNRKTKMNNFPISITTIFYIDNQFIDDENISVSSVASAPPIIGHHLTSMLAEANAQNAATVSGSDSSHSCSIRWFLSLVRFSLTGTIITEYDAHHSMYVYGLFAVSNSNFYFISYLNLSSFVCAFARF